jgi:hypothetical protein
MPRPTLTSGKKPLNFARREGWRLLAACVAVSAVAGVGAAAGAAPSSPRNLATALTDAPPPLSKLCFRPITRPVNIVDDGQTAPTDIHCGSRYADTIVARGGGDTVYAAQGNDFIDARNRKPDEIFPGLPGDADWGKFDSCDTSNGPLPKKLRKYQSTKPCPEVYPSPRALNGRLSPAELVYPKINATIECYARGDGTWMIRFVEEPRMRAVDSTRRVDWQSVAWSSVLYKLVGPDPYASDSWQSVEQTVWLWDRTYDEQVQRFAGNFWKLFDTTDRRFLYHLAVEPGTYRVAVRYHWYATKEVPAHTFQDWAGYHYGPVQGPPYQWCTVTP